MGDEARKPGEDEVMGQQPEVTESPPTASAPPEVPQPNQEPVKEKRFNERGEVVRRPQPTSEAGPQENAEQPVEQPKNDLDVLREMKDPQEILAKVHELLKKSNPWMIEGVLMATSEALTNAGEVNLGAQFLLTAQKESQLRREQEVADSQRESVQKMFGVMDEFRQVASKMEDVAEMHGENNRIFARDVARLEEVASNNATTAGRIEESANVMKSAAGKIEDSAQTISSAANKMSSNY